MCEKGRDTETTEETANSFRSLKKPGQLQRRFPKNEKHEMEVEIEKVVKSQKEVQSAAEMADREEQIAHNKESRITSSAKEYVAKVEAELQKIGDDILALMDNNFIPSARRITGGEGHQQKTPKRSSSLSKSILNRSQRSDRLAMWPRTTRILRSKVVYPRTHITTQSSCRGRATEICEEVPGDLRRKETICRDKEQGSDGEELT